MPQSVTIIPQGVTITPIGVTTIPAGVAISSQRVTIIPEDVTIIPIGVAINSQCVTTIPQDVTIIPIGVTILPSVYGSMNGSFSASFRNPDAPFRLPWVCLKCPLTLLLLFKKLGHSENGHGDSS